MEFNNTNKVLLPAFNSHQGFRSAKPRVGVLGGVVANNRPRQVPIYSEKYARSYKDKFLKMVKNHYDPCLQVDGMTHISGIRASMIPQEEEQEFEPIPIVFERPRSSSTGSREIRDVSFDETFAESPRLSSVSPSNLALPRLSTDPRRRSTNRSLSPSFSETSPSHRRTLGSKTICMEPMSPHDAEADMAIISPVFHDRPLRKSVTVSPASIRKRSTRLPSISNPPEPDPEPVVEIIEVPVLPPIVHDERSSFDAGKASVADRERRKKDHVFWVFDDDCDLHEDFEKKHNGPNDLERRLRDLYSIISPKQKEMYENLFQGIMGENETPMGFEDFMESLCPGQTTDSAKFIFDLFDLNNDETVSKEEFVTVCSLRDRIVKMKNLSFKGNQDPKEVLDCFKIVSKFLSIYKSMHELMAEDEYYFSVEGLRILILSGIGSKGLDERVADKALRKINMNGDGDISFLEFVNFIPFFLYLHNLILKRNPVTSIDEEKRALDFH